MEATTWMKFWEMLSVTLYRLSQLTNELETLEWLIDVCEVFSYLITLYPDVVFFEELMQGSIWVE